MNKTEVEDFQKKKKHDELLLIADDVSFVHEFHSSALLCSLLAVGNGFYSLNN